MKGILEVKNERKIVSWNANSGEGFLEKNQGQKGGFFCD